MTDVQVRYATHLETVRSNLANEAERKRSNLAQEQELKRSNLAREQETNRSNLAREGETNRHNLVIESHSLRQLQENERHNYATERETNRHNVVSERLTADSNAIARQRNEIAKQGNYYSYLGTLARVDAQREANDIARMNATTNQVRTSNDYELGSKRLINDAFSKNGAVSTIAGATVGAGLTKLKNMKGSSSNSTTIRSATQDYRKNYDSKGNKRTTVGKIQYTAPNSTFDPFVFIKNPYIDTTIRPNGARKVQQ